MEKLGKVLGGEPSIAPSTNTDFPDNCFCKGTGQGRWTASPVPGEGVVVEYCPCDIGQVEKAKYEKELAESKAIARRQIAEARWEKTSRIPKRWQDCRLSTSPVAEAQPKLIAALTYREAPEELVDEAKWQTWLERYDRSWFFWGGYGTGKTGLAVSYAYDKIWHDSDQWGQPPYVVFTTVPDLLTELRATYNKTSERTESDVLDFYDKPDCLILDDLGAEQVTNTGWLEDRLYQVIGHRHAQEKQMIFTSNLSLKQLAERIGERIVWRIIEMCGKDNIIEIKGPNLRDVLN